MCVHNPGIIQLQCSMIHTRQDTGQKHDQLDCQSATVQLLCQIHSENFSRLAKAAIMDTPVDHGHLGLQACLLSPQYMHAAPASSGLSSLLTQPGPPRQACLHTFKTQSRRLTWSTTPTGLHPGQNKCMLQGIHSEMGCSMTSHSAYSSPMMHNLQTGSPLLSVASAGRGRGRRAEGREQRAEYRGRLQAQWLIWDRSWTETNCIIHCHPLNAKAMHKYESGHSTGTGRARGRGTPADPVDGPAAGPAA